MYFCWFWADYDVRVVLKNASRFLAEIVEKKSNFSTLYFQANVKETDLQSAHQLESMFQPFVESTLDNIVSTAKPV